MRRMRRIRRIRRIGRIRRIRQIRRIGLIREIMAQNLRISEKNTNFAPKMKMSSIIVPQGMRRVLLHACCAPCSSAIVEWLCAHEIEPIIFYFNPNIYPQEEYEIRKAESKRHAESLGIQWIDGDEPHPGPPLKSRVESQESRVESQESRVERCYNQAHAEWLEAMRGLENEPERGSRCVRCFYYRMLATAKKAQELGIPYFATTLASSRWKNLEQINAAGEKAAEDVGCKMADVGCQMLDVHFWAQNWRKEGLQERRNALLKEYAFYNQQYCGCEFSMRSTK